jgi:hypothetical protein
MKHEVSGPQAFAAGAALTVGTCSESRNNDFGW